MLCACVCFLLNRNGGLFVDKEVIVPKDPHIYDLVVCWLCCRFSLLLCCVLFVALVSLLFVRDLLSGWFFCCSLLLWLSVFVCLCRVP